MTAGFCCVLIAISQTITWGWDSPKTLGLPGAGLLGVAWVAVEVGSDEPLIDMTMMRIRGVWTNNLVAFLLGAGMYASFLIYPQFAQLARSTGFGFGASVVTAGLYPLPAALGVSVLGTFAGRVAHRFGSKLALVVGSGVTVLAFGWLAGAHAHPYDMLISAALLGIGIGLAFSALGDLIVEPVPSHQTGVATGMNTVMRTLGGALGGQDRPQRVPRSAHGDRLHRVVRARGRIALIAMPDIVRSIKLDPLISCNSFYLLRDLLHARDPGAGVESAADTRHLSAISRRPARGVRARRCLVAAAASFFRGGRPAPSPPDRFRAGQPASNIGLALVGSVRRNSDINRE